MAPADIVGSTSTGSTPKATVTLDPSLLRATNVHTVLRGCCSTFRSKEPIESNYQLSFETTHISDFLSHDWASSRWAKLLGLCLVYNSRAAMVASLLAACVLAALQYGPDPVLSFPKSEADFNAADSFGAFYARLAQAREYGSWCQLCCPLVFVLFFLFWQDIRALTPLGTRTCFLDKLCIDQTNPERKAAGIFGLAGFLRCSDRLVVLWTPQYFTRLWCTYEVASWLHLKKPMSSVLLMPLAHAQIVLTLLISWCFGTTVLAVSFLILQELFVIGCLFGFVTALAVGAHQARRSTRHLHTLTQQLESFSVTSSQCYCCSVSHRRSTGMEVPCDRQVVYDTIIEWFGERSKLMEGDEAALAHFDQAVRRRFAPQVLAKAGPTKLPYCYAMVVGWAFVFRGFDVLACAGRIESYKWSSMIVYPALVFCVAPVWVKLSMHLAWASDKWMGAPCGLLADYLLSLALGLAYSLIFVILWAPLELLASSGTQFWPVVVASLTLVVATAGLYAQDLPELPDLFRLRIGAKKGDAPASGEAEDLDAAVTDTEVVEAATAERSPGKVDGTDQAFTADARWVIDSDSFSVHSI